MADVRPERVVFQIGKCSDRYGRENVTQGNGSFTDAIGRVSDIEALNKSTKGLQILEKTVRAGGPRVQQIVDGGANAVMDTVLGDSGITSETVFGAINRVNTGVVNNVVASSEDIHDRIRTGSFSTDDIPRYTRDFANVIKTAGKIITPSDSQTSGRTVCQYAPYVNDLLNYGLKLNYRFLVNFEFDPAYGDSIGKLDHKFLITESERPRITYDYEDINIYNFRTRVPIKSNYQPITMSFYDDADSQVLDFIRMYAKATIPSANTLSLADSALLEENLFNFANTTSVESGRNPEFSMDVKKFASSIGSLLDNATTVLSVVRIVHVYRGGGLMDVYSLYRPRITELSLNELTMVGGSDVTTASIVLEYDALNIDTYIRTDGGAMVEYNQSLIDQHNGHTHRPEHTINPLDLVLPSDSTDIGSTNGSLGEGNIQDTRSISESVRQFASDVTKIF